MNKKHPIGCFYLSFLLSLSFNKQNSIILTITLLKEVLFIFAIFSIFLAKSFFTIGLVKYLVFY